MMSQIKIVICDNDERRVVDWKTRIDEAWGEGAAHVRALPPSDFGQAVKALHERVRDAKAGHVSRDDGAAVIDSADVLILDSDLTPDPDDESGSDPNKYVETYLVGEVGQAVARLARAHSTAGAIVVVNQVVKRRTFDLTMTRWASGPADAYISHDDVDNVGLWFGGSPHGFRPWTWPTLATLPGAVSKFMESVSLDDKVLDTLGLKQEGRVSLSFRQLEALAGDVDDPLEISFRNVASSPTLGMGQQPKDDERDEQLLRVAVWGVRRWLDRTVVPPQAVLVDLAHLMQDRPWHAVNREDLDSWNGDRRIWETPNGIDALAAAYNEPASILLDRPVWNADRLPIESSAENRLRPDDPVFCEDTSRFLRPDDAKDFQSDLEGPFTTRYVEMLEDVDYTPRHRLFQ